MIQSHSITLSARWSHWELFAVLQVEALFGDSEKLFANSPHPNCTHALIVTLDGSGHCEAGHSLVVGDEIPQKP